MLFRSGHGDFGKGKTYMTEKMLWRTPSQRVDTGPNQRLGNICSAGIKIAMDN